MEKLIIKQLDPKCEVYSERIATRITPTMKEDLARVAAETNRTVDGIVRIALGWALERIEVACEEIEQE
ncbi:MAG: hypothetical protein NC087_04580 [Anaeroplasma bactoclasticum]|nr:hypothetical protein [Anaeroplasma bactoclasticum]